ncbi:MAG: hypothetical protein MUE85_19250 [Microscillaceae bacterium]|jgi:hypothetical protein|nr:hypothetical protein [Microscillaceae bacterium]
MTSHSKVGHLRDLLAKLPRKYFNQWLADNFSEHCLDMLGVWENETLEAEIKTVENLFKEQTKYIIIYKSFRYGDLEEDFQLGYDNETQRNAEFDRLKTQLLASKDYELGTCNDKELHYDSPGGKWSYYIGKGSYTYFITDTIDKIVI